MQADAKIEHSDPATTSGGVTAPEIVGSIEMENGLPSLGVYFAAGAIWIAMGMPILDSSIANVALPVSPATSAPALSPRSGS